MQFYAYKLFLAVTERGRVRALWFNNVGFRALRRLAVMIGKIVTALAEVILCQPFDEGVQITDH
jgi:hypothetical protein